MNIHLPLWAAILAATVSTSDAGSAFDETHSKLAESLRHDSLKLEITLPKASYFLGEVIPVNFRFEDTKNTGRYKVWTGSVDRSGLIPGVEFTVDGPEGSFCDPLSLYFSIHLILLSGSGSYDNLGNINSSHDLNEWIRFDKPGRYRLYATSSKIAQQMEGGQVEIKLISSVVDIEIRTPTPEEQNDAFHEAVAAFAPGGDQNQKLSTIQAETRLRFLDTDASRRKLRDLLGEPDFQGEAMLGLIGTREIDASMALLLEGLTAPEVAITWSYFDTLATLRRTQRGEVATPSPKFGHFVNPFGDIEDWKKLIECFDQKTGRACDVSAMTLFERVRYEVKNAELDLQDRLDHDAVLARIRVPLAARFDRLQYEEQRQLLRSSWEFIRCPEFIPPLRRIVAAPMEQPDFAESNSVRSLALLRYVELEPAAGGAIILDDIRRPRPNYSLEVLCALPLEQVQGELPLLAANFASEGADLEKIAGMIAHYGDRSIYDAVKARYLAISISPKLRWDLSASQKVRLKACLVSEREKEEFDRAFGG